MQPYQPNQPSANSPAFDKHTIETPEQMPLDFAIAGIGSRFLALAIDTLIQVGAGLAVVIVLAILGLTGALTGLLRGQSVWIFAGLVAGVFLIYFGYFAFFEILWNGQTPGKRALGLRVIKDSGRPLTAAETIGRNFLRIVDQLPSFYGLGILIALCNRQNKRLGDFVAGSIVIRETPFDKKRSIWRPGVPEISASSGPLGAASISLQDLTLIETFLERRYDLTPVVRSRMATEIFDRIKGGLTLSAISEGAGVETVLESVAHERRSSGGYS